MKGKQAPIEILHGSVGRLSIRPGQPWCGDNRGRVTVGNVSFAARWVVREISSSNQIDYSPPKKIKFKIPREMEEIIVYALRRFLT